MRGLLVRVGIDKTYGWNAPVDSRSLSFAYVPIEEGGKGRHGLERWYEELQPCLEKFGQSLPRHLFLKKMHLDPDFEFLTYGDTDGEYRQRAKQIRTLRRGDMLVFYAGLRDCAKPTDRLVYALIGVYVIQDIQPAKSVRKKLWKANAHTRRIPHSGDIVVFAKPRVSGRLSRCIPIGEYRKRAYRVKRNVLKAWGGLDVKDGYLQRSGHLPEFMDIDRFCRWFANREVRLVNRNN